MRDQSEGFCRIFLRVCSQAVPAQRDGLQRNTEAFYRPTSARPRADPRESDPDAAWSIAERQSGRRGAGKSRESCRRWAGQTRGTCSGSPVARSAHGWVGERGEVWRTGRECTGAGGDEVQSTASPNSKRPSSSRIFCCKMEKKY